MDSATQFFVSLGVTAAIGIVGIYYQHRQLQAVTPAVAAAQRKGRYSPIVLMALFAALAWTPFLLPKEDLRVIHDVQWGAYSVENNRVVLRVYGDFRDLVAAYGQTHRVMALAAHFFGNVDPRDSEELQKSPLHYIAMGQTIFVIPTDDKFTKEVQNGPPGSSYLYLMVPKEVEANQFKTIRQAERLGAKVLVSGSGPP